MAAASRVRLPRRRSCRCRPAASPGLRPAAHTPQAPGARHRRCLGESESQVRRMTRAVPSPAAPGPDLAAAYAACADITRRQARNFYYGIALLPPPTSGAMTGVYSVSPRIDDIGDGDLPPDTKRSLLEQTRNELAALSRGDPPPSSDQIDRKSV